MCDDAEDLEGQYLQSINSSSTKVGLELEDIMFRSNNSNGGWSASKDDSYPYVEYIFNKTVVIVEVETRNIYNQTSYYTMKYQQGSDEDLVSVLENAGEVDETENQSVTEKKFVLSSFGTTNTYYNLLDTPIKTTKVRVYPIGAYVEMKLKFYGCLPEEAVTTPVVSTTSKEITTTTRIPVTEKSTQATQTSTIASETTTGMSHTAKPTTVETVTVETTTATVVPTGSQANSSTPIVPTSSATTVVTTKQVSSVATTETPSAKRCDEALGMEMNASSKVDYQIVSNVSPDVNDPFFERARLNSDSSWSTESSNKYIGVVFPNHPVTISSILMQGDAETGDRVTEFYIEIIIDNEATFLEDGNKTFVDETYDGSTIKEIELSPHLNDVQEIRIYPIHWRHTASVRIELKGCFILEETTTATETSKTIVTTKTVPSTATESTASTTESATPEVTVTTTKTMPVTSEVVVTSTPKFSTKPTSATTRTTEKVSICRQLWINTCNYTLRYFPSMLFSFPQIFSLRLSPLGFICL